MDKKKIDKILELAKKKELIRIGDVHREIGLNQATALSYLLEMEIRGLLERKEMQRSENYSYKIWRLKTTDKK